MAGLRWRRAPPLAEQGFDVQHVVANLAEEDGIRAIVAAHRERYGRLDVLVNNGGMGVGAGVGELQTKHVDLQLGGEGIRSVALCPGWVDTDMTDFIKGEVPAEQMIRHEDVAAAVGFVLSLSPAAVVPEIVFQRPGGGY